MVAVAQLMPKDPDAERTVRDVLAEHPELPGFIARAIERAHEVFDDPRFELDTMRYDEWDPPLTLNIYVPMPMASFRPAFDDYLHWLHAQPEHDEELMLVFPRFDGPLDDRGRELLDVVDAIGNPLAQHPTVFATLVSGADRVSRSHRVL